MRARYWTCYIALWANGVLVAQTAIQPIWSQLVPSSTKNTRLAYDDGTDLLQLAYQPGPSDCHIYIRAFSTDGMEEGMELSIGTLFPTTYTTCYPYANDTPLRLLAQDDTLHLLDRLVTKDFSSWARYTSITVDSSTTFAMHTGSGDQVDIHHDHYGDITASSTVIRNYSNAHWLMGRASVPTTDRIAANAVRIYAGRLPNIIPIERVSMTLLPPIVLPSSGTSTKTVLHLSNDVLFYASLNDNQTLDVGLVDTAGVLMWNSSLVATGVVTLVDLASDAIGNFWVAANRGGSTASGLLYRFDNIGLLTGEYSYGLNIQSVVSSGDRLFFAGRDATVPSMVYLAAIDTDISTSLYALGPAALRLAPNPASNSINIDGLPAGVTRMIITDVTGRYIEELPGPFVGSMIVPVAHLTNGTYLLRCATEDRLTTSCFTIMN